VTRWSRMILGRIDLNLNPALIQSDRARFRFRPEIIAL
jgi:hypothetical protein